MSCRFLVTEPQCERVSGVNVSVASYLLDNCPSLFLPQVKSCLKLCSLLSAFVKILIIMLMKISWSRGLILRPSPSLPHPLRLFIWQAPEQDEVLQSIDRAIEGIHNVALKNGGKYNLEQRDVLQ